MALDQLTTKKRTRPTKTFNGSSTKDIENAIHEAIMKAPKGDPGTDMFQYEVKNIRVDWGGFAQTTTYYVTLER